MVHSSRSKTTKPVLLVQGKQLSFDMMFEEDGPEAIAVPAAAPNTSSAPTVCVQVQEEGAPGAFSSPVVQLSPTARTVPDSLTIAASRRGLVGKRMESLASGSPDLSFLTGRSDLSPAKDFRVGDVVKRSSAGPGTITSFTERGIPRVQDVAVIWLEREDGQVYDPKGKRR